MPSPCITFLAGPLGLSPLHQSFRAHTSIRRTPMSSRNRKPTLPPHTIRSRIPPPSAEEDSQFVQLKADIQAYLQTCPDSGQNPLTYVNLGKAGRADLIPRIMENGGYIEVSRRLAIPVEESDFIPPPIITNPSNLGLQKQDPGASLVVGRDLEARLGTVEEVADNSADTNNSLASPSRISRLRPKDDVPSAEQLRLANESFTPPVVDQPIPDGERFTLSVGMRAGMLLWITALALGFGRSSHTVLSEDIIQLCRSVAEALTVGHVVVAGYVAVVLAPQLKRNRGLWFLKVLLSGPIGLRNLRALGSL